MERLCVTHERDRGLGCGVEMVQSNVGEYVRFEDAQAEIAKLRAERDEAKRTLVSLFDDTKAEMGRLRSDLAAARAALDGERELRSKCVGAIVTHPRDWAAERRDAWIYGCIVGWEDCLDGIAKKHGWSAADVAMLRSLDARRAAEAKS